MTPRARYVTLRPYTAVRATMIPNLGLRLVFPPAWTGALVLAVTNPLFRATALPRAGGVVLTARGGFHHRYCGNVFAALHRFRVSLLVCTSDAVRHYASDLIFVAPPTGPAPRAVRRTSPWAAWATRLLCARPRRRVIRKRAMRWMGAEAVTLEVRSQTVIGGQELLAARVRASPRPVRILGLAVYDGRPWRARAARFHCEASRDPYTDCMVVARRPHRPVRRWHMVLVTGRGSVRVSW
ncbi:MAG: hypothetical protein M0Z76_09870 [Gammaproteobacteria bacterium]|nr:hypothetical protein [Gammaproteobacteria bacterium]